MRPDEMLRWDEWLDDAPAARAALEVAEEARVSGAVRDVLERAVARDVPPVDMPMEDMTPDAWADLQWYRRILRPFGVEFGARIRERMDEMERGER